MARTGDQTRRLNLQSITVAEACRDFWPPTIGKWSQKCCERKHCVNRNILYLVTVCPLEMSNSFLAFYFFWFVRFEVLRCSTMFYVFVYTRVYSVVYGLEHNMHLVFMKYGSNYFKIDVTLITNVSYHHILYLKRVCNVGHFIRIWLFSVQKKNTFKDVVIYVKVKRYRSVLQAVNTY